MLEMLGKLSLRNAKRQAKDYIIYFITIVISVALIFSFNSIAFSKDIQELSEMMKYFNTSIVVVSVIVVLVIAWLVNYTMKFMLEKRSKEFGTYQILGIEKKNISNIFILENVFIGITALIVGIAVGTLLYQLLTSVIMNIFNQPYKIQIDFNLNAVGLTVIYFGAIFLVALINNRRKIRKTKIHDLLYAEKQNENQLVKKSKGNVIIFCISIILFIIALALTKHTFRDGNTISGNLVLIAIITLIIGIYLFYISISSFIIKRYLENKNRKYQKNNMFIFRNLTSKINTMSVTMGTLAVIFTVVIIGCDVAMLMNGMLNNEIDMGYTYEIMLSSLDGDFSRYKEYIEKNAKVKEMYEYRTYYVPETGIIAGLTGSAFEGGKWYSEDDVMKLSDYNKLREILGYENVTLQDDEIIVQCISTVQKNFEEYIEENNTLTINNKQFKIKEVRGEHFAQSSGFNSYIYMIVVTDEALEQLNCVEASEEEVYDFPYKLVVQTEEPTTEKFYEGLRELIPTEEIPQIEEIDGEQYEYTYERNLANVKTRGKRMSESKSFYTIISFLAFYIALVFSITSATILAIQQLSDSEKYKYRYQLLKKLGVEDSKLNKMIIKQLFIYFALPMLIPVIISIPATLFIGNIFLVGITIEEILLNIAVVLGLLFIVYGIYFIATVVQFERNINEEMRG